MPTLIELQTPRLLLRQWRDADRAPFAAMNADPRVRQYFPKVLSGAESDASLARFRAHVAERGWGCWALELRASGAFIGFTGLWVPGHDLPFAPCVEIGWRLAQPHWGQGYATEAARAALAAGFERIGLDEVVSFTVPANAPSRAVMARIGMTDADADFDHPAIAAGHPLRRHCLYRITRAQWRAQQ